MQAGLPNWAGKVAGKVVCLKKPSWFSPASIPTSSNKINALYRGQQTFLKDSDSKYARLCGNTLLVSTTQFCLCMAKATIYNHKQMNMDGYVPWNFISGQFAHFYNRTGNLLKHLLVIQAILKDQFLLSGCIPKAVFWWQFW